MTNEEKSGQPAQSGSDAPKDDGNMATGSKHWFYDTNAADGKADSEGDGNEDNSGDEIEDTETGSGTMGQTGS